VEPREGKCSVPKIVFFLMMASSLASSASRRTASMLSGVGRRSFAVKLLDMPALSPTMATGKIAKWGKQPGDSLKSGDVLAEVETDKVRRHGAPSR
jgi:hypothetical protein